MAIASSKAEVYRQRAKEAAQKARTALLARVGPEFDPDAAGPPPEELPEEVRRAREDFPYYCALMGKPQPPHMRRWNDAILTGQSTGQLGWVAGPDFALLSPRGSAKSTYVALLLSWLIGKHALERKLLRILYVSYNVSVARAKSASVKTLVQSEEYQRIFPCVRLSKHKKGDELWAIDFKFAGIDIRGEDAFTIACAGLRGAITSKRANLIVVDDLIKSAQDIANPDVRREMESNWTQVIVPTRFEGGRTLVLGTRFHFDDMFATTFTPAKGWKVVVQAALEYEDDGTPRSYWPQMHSLKYLLKLQSDDYVSFAYQYLNHPVSTTELGISPEVFRSGEIPEVFDTIGIGMDLSAGLTERNDWTVLTLAGRLGDTVYIIDYRRLRTMGNIEKIEAMCELLTDWNLVFQDEHGKYHPSSSEVLIWPEAVAYQKSFKGDFERIAHFEWGLHNLIVRPVAGVRGDKLVRLRGMMGSLQTGKVIFNKYRNFKTMTDEVLNFGHSTWDDCADSLNMVVQGLFARSPADVEY